MLAKEYGLFNDDVAFWGKWSLNGKRLPIATIFAILSRKKRNDDEQTAHTAREEYQGEQFTRHFSYLKSGARVVITKSSAIARRYRQLKSC